MDLTGKKVAILVEEMYQVLEVWYPYYRLVEAGAEVDFLGTGKDSYPSKEGYPVPSHGHAKDASPDDYHGVIVPGGFAPDYMRRHEGPVEFVKAVADADKVVAAICHGLWVPASAGILKDKRCTCYYAIKDDIIHAGAVYSDEEVVVDGKLVSSRKPDDLPAFMRETMKLLNQ